MIKHLLFRFLEKSLWPAYKKNLQSCVAISLERKPLLNSQQMLDFFFVLIFLFLCILVPDPVKATFVSFEEVDAETTVM